MLLGDLGASVLRLDRPGGGLFGTPESVAYDHLSRSRTATLTVDLKASRQRDAVLDLVDHADVLIEGFRPGVAERLGLGPDPTTSRNPRLIYGRMTGWGQDGPLAHTAGHDIDYIAVAGVLGHIGRAGQPPTPPLNLVGDNGGGGLLLAFGVCAALVERATSGRGQVVDAAMVDGAAALMAPFVGAVASGFWSTDRGTNLLDSGAPFYDCYETADGEWMAVGAIEPQFFAALLEGLGLAGGDIDQHDQARWPELRATLADTFRARSRSEWVEVFDGTDACVAPVLTVTEAAGHPHNVARGTYVDVDGVPHPGPAPRFDRTPAPPIAPPTTPAADPREALTRWGLDDAGATSIAQALELPWTR